MNLGKYLGIGALCLSLAGSVTGNRPIDLESQPLEQIVEQNKFSKLWKQITNYNRALKENYGNNDSLIEPAYSNFVDYVKTNYTNINLQEMCIKNNKVCMIVKEENNDYNTLILGRIIKKYNNTIYLKDERLDYRIILFEKTEENLNDVLNKNGISGFWDEDVKTAFVDINSLKKQAELIHYLGCTDNNIKDTFSEEMSKELCDKIGNNKENFVNILLKSMIKSTKDHEIMHHFSLRTDVNNFEEGELKPFLYEISRDPNYNAWIFFTLSNTKNNGVYSEFQKEGFTFEQIKKMSPEERSIIAEIILNKINLFQK